MKKHIAVSAIEHFTNIKFNCDIRILADENGEPLFCAKDIASALGYKDPDQAIRKNCRYPSLRRVPHPQSKTKTFEMTFIYEADVYCLVFRSRLPSAQEFAWWIAKEVLPTLREKGVVANDEASVMLSKLYLDSILETRNIVDVMEHKQRKDMERLKEDMRIIKSKYNNNRDEDGFYVLDPIPGSEAYRFIVLKKSPVKSAI